MEVLLCSIVFPSPNSGILPGPERLVHRLATSLRDKQVRVRVITSFWNGGRPTERVDGIQIHRGPSSGDRAGMIGRAFAMHYLTWGRQVLRMTKVFRDADVVHALSPLSSVRAIRKLGVPVVAHFHHLARIRKPRDALSVPWQNFLERHTFRHADLVTAASRATGKDLENAFRIPKDRIRILPYGVDVPQDHPSEKRDERNLLYVGIFERRKGIETLIRAVARLRPDYPDLRLTIAGDGPSRPHLERLAQKLDLRGRIAFPGHVSDAELERLYARSGIFVLPSLQEGFGLVLLEAMAHGLPVVTTTAGAIPEVVGDCAICVRPGDTKALTAGLRRVLDDAALRQDLSKRGRERVVKFSWDAMAQKALEVYDSLGGGGQSGP